MLDHFTQHESFEVMPIVEMKAELFGTEFSLGAVRLFHEDVRLTNEQEVREQIAAADAEVRIQFQFEPGSSDRVVYQYLDWGATLEAPSGPPIDREQLQAN